MTKRSNRGSLPLLVVLVVGMRLGCLNHARLSFEAIERSGRSPFLGWIGNQVDPAFERLDGNVRALERLLASPPLALVPAAGPAPTRTPGTSTTSSCAAGFG